MTYPYLQRKSTHIEWPRARRVIWKKGCLKKASLLRLIKQSKSRRNKNKQKMTRRRRMDKTNPLMIETTELTEDDVLDEVLGVEDNWCIEDEDLYAFV